MQTLITRQTRGGQLVTLGIHKTSMHWSPVATLDGKRIQSGIAELPEGQRPSPEFTHRFGNLALLAGEAQQLRTAAAEANANDTDVIAYDAEYRREEQSRLATARSVDETASVSRWIARQ